MSFWNTLGAGLNIAAGLDMANTFDDLGNLANTEAQTIGANAAADSAFTGYGVQTGLGNSTVDAQGNMNLGVGPDAAMQGLAGSLAGGGMDAFNQAMQMAGAQNQWAGQAQNMMGQGYDQMAGAFANIPGREQEIYNRAMAMQQPGLDAQRASQQAREYAMGRGGVRGSQFGGTAEDAATARAQAQAQNQASFQAMGQAQQEAMNAANVGNQMFGAGSGYNAAGLGNAQLSQAGGQIMGGLGGSMMGAGQNYYGQSFLPMQQQLAAMEIGGQAADRFQTGQLTGANLEAQAGLTGLEALINANKVGAELTGNLYGSAANAIGGMNPGGSEGGFFETIFGGLIKE